MKKTLAIILSVVMILSIMPFAAFAANNGPANVNYAYVEFFDATEDGSATNTGTVYYNYKAYNSAVAGATYDKTSNTLTLNNYNNPKACMSANMMGDDFKLNIVGTCALAGMYVYGDGWGGSLTITGTGTLTINENKYSGDAISLQAEHTAAALTVDSGVTVKIYGGTDGSVFNSWYNLYDDPDDVVVAKSGQDVFELTATPYCEANNTYVTANIIVNASSTRNGGYITTKSDDASGIYGTSIWTGGDGSPEYHVTRYIHSDVLGVDLEDPGFVEEYGNDWGEIAFTQEEFDNLGFSMNVTGQTTVHAFCFSGSTTLSGFRLVNASDPTGIYMVDWQSYSYSDLNDFASYTFYGAIYKLVLNEYGSTEVDTSFTPIALGTSSSALEALPSGYSLALTNEYESFTVQGSLSSVSGSLYLDANDNEYVIYNLWDSSGEHHYVYALSEISDIPGAYLGELREDIDYTTLTEYVEYEDTDMFNYFTDVTEFTFTGNGTAPQPTVSFPDVNKGDWYYDAVDYCASRGFVTGYKNGNFGPADQLQRQDFVVILARIAGADLSQHTSCALKDVNMSAYYGPSVAWAVDKGIIKGYNNGNFGVGDPITREQVCTMLYRYMGSPAVSDANSILSGFSDRGNISSFALNPMAWAVSKGIIKGKTATTVAPLGNASRAEIATIVMRMDQAGMFDPV